ncbi:MAG: uracil-DNA glycosylase [Desulfuromonadales bacterium]|nr:uracil-DNA glycosylase [Desulfuromonadales bacterium]
MPNELKTELQTAVGEARGMLEDLQRLGLGEIYPDPGSILDSTSDLIASGQLGTENLMKIEADVVDCRRCSLAAENTKALCGVGHPDAQLVFIDGSPGPEEEQSGEPFAGAAGELLDRILNAMGLARSDVYLLYVVKCPPGDVQHPGIDEIAACVPFLIRQIESIRPEIIVTLGSFASQTLLQSDQPIAQMRGHWQQYRNISLMPTLHPSDLLNNPLGKREAWDDMKQVIKRLREGQDDNC